MHAEHDRAPTQPAGGPRLTVWLALSACLVAGCAATGAPTSTSDSQLTRIVDELSRVLPGRYSRVQDRDSAPSPGELVVSTEQLEDSDGLLALLTQQTSEGTRRFLVEIDGQLGPDRLGGTFAPVDASGHSRQRCAMTFHLRTGGLVGRTDPDQCRFGSEESQTALLKEVAFDGRRIVVGDRVIRVADGELAVPEQIAAFYRSRQFQGRAALREGGSWRQAAPFALDTTAVRITPGDAAAMSLGIELELAFYRTNEAPGHDILLRLSAFDGETGELVGRAWSAADSVYIGITLPRLQVVLRD